MKLSKDEYNKLAAFAFSEGNPGYKPEVVESPNGDGVWDEKKKYAHIAPKYFSVTPSDLHGLDNAKAMYNKAHDVADSVCKHLGLPEKYWGGPDSTLRVLHYPPGATTAPHTDFNLFTICMYRDDINAFKYLEGENEIILAKGRRLSPGLHIGEIMTEINGAQATKHEVLGTDNTQCSAVFFVVPAHDAILPSGKTVGEWMANRIKRSRK